jgi:hypothetical protein
MCWLGYANDSHAHVSWVSGPSFAQPSGPSSNGPQRSALASWRTQGRRRGWPRCSWKCVAFEPPQSTPCNESTCQQHSKTRRATPGTSGPLTSYRTRLCTPGPIMVLPGVESGMGFIALPRVNPPQRLHQSAAHQDNARNGRGQRVRSRPCRGPGSNLKGPGQHLPGTLGAVPYRTRLCSQRPIMVLSCVEPGSHLTVS